VFPQFSIHIESTYTELCEQLPQATSPEVRPIVLQYQFSNNFFTSPASVWSSVRVASIITGQLAGDGCVRVRVLHAGGPMVSAKVMAIIFGKVL
jgi:hypothetical protein